MMNFSSLQRSRLGESIKWKPNESNQLRLSSSTVLLEKLSQSILHVYGGPELLMVIVWHFASSCRIIAGGCVARPNVCCYNMVQHLMASCIACLGTL